MWFYILWSSTEELVGRFLFIFFTSPQYTHWPAENILHLLSVSGHGVKDKNTFKSASAVSHHHYLADKAFCARLSSFLCCWHLLPHRVSWLPCQKSKSLCWIPLEVLSCFAKLYTEIKLPLTLLFWVSKDLNIYAWTCNLRNWFLITVPKLLLLAYMLFFVTLLIWALSNLV